MTKRTPEQRARKGRAIARWAAALHVPSEPSPDAARLLESPALDALAAALAPWFHADRKDP